MSEFTEGILMLKRDQEIFLKKERSTFDLEPLNERWFRVVSEVLHSNRSSLEDEWLQLARDIPLLHFCYFEDHGWGYDILFEGEKRASIFVSYELSSDMANTLADQRYSQSERQSLNMDMWSALYEEVQKSSAYRETVIQQFIHRNIDMFKVFDLSEENLKELEEVVSPDFLLKDEEGPFRQASEFKRIIGIEEMEWMNEI